MHNLLCDTSRAEAGATRCGHRDSPWPGASGLERRRWRERPELEGKIILKGNFKKLKLYHLIVTVVGSDFVQFNRRLALGRGAGRQVRAGV